MKNKTTRISYAVRLSHYIKGFGWYLFAAILCNMSFKLLPLLTSLATSYLVSSVLIGDTSHVVRLLATTGILVLLTALFSYLDVQVSHDMAYRILTQLRDRCYDKLNDLAPAALMGKRSGDMISIVLGDVEQLEWFYAHTIGQLVVAVAVPAAALIFMGWLSWLLPAIILPFIVLLILIPRYTAGKANEQGSKVKQATGILHAIIVDGVQGLKDIISFRWQQEYMKRFYCADRNCSEASIAYAKRRADENRGITLIMGLASLAANIAAVALVVAGKIPVIWLMPLFVLSSAIFVPIQEALSMSTNYGLIFGAAERVLALFDMQPAVQDSGEETVECCDGVVVRFENVSFSYPATGEDKPSTAVLKGLDFEFHTGETVALVGASGEGKTTVARLLQRFWDVDAGKITINGLDVRELSVDSLRRAVTVVPQEVYLFNVSVAENLRLARLDASDFEIREAAQLARADNFISKLPDGYKTLIGERGLRLSGGEKQRLSIAQAFLKNAPILVLDEASANLDAENERMINEAVSHLKRGRATLVIAHRISTIRSADRVVMVKDGRAIASGSYKDLIGTCPDFRELIGEEYEDSNKKQKGK
ncbi:MAG: ABC transporter ATP-binding protein [Eubacteriales bacterium]|nr:ABC transporter ATP-binding protein [Eubacteriales bacterium]